MKTSFIITCFFLLVFLSNSFIYFQDDDKGKANFYSKSLHATNRGIGYIYAKEQGGLEKLTGITARDLGCYKAKCHATTCDDCHLKEMNGQKIYVSDTVTLCNACKKCHGDMAKDNPDVHFKKGLTCMNCHTSKEMHGDGTEHNTYLEPGFFDVKCEKCHISLSKIESHTVHKDKLACIACHDDENITCLNCHIDNRLKSSKDVQIPLKHMTFLLNHNGRVTLGNMLSYVYQNRTMITFAKTFIHSVKRDGRKCVDCHCTEIAKKIKDNSFRMVWWENDSLYNVKGIIPVLEGYDWNLVYLNNENGKWIPIMDPPKPLLNYSGSCSPITIDQFEKILKNPVK